MTTDSSGTAGVSALAGLTVVASLLLIACSPTSTADSASKTSNLAAETAAKQQASAPTTLPAQVSELGSARPPVASVSSENDRANEAEKAVSASIDALLGDHTAYQAMIADLRKAVVADDADAVAKLVDYPIEVTIKGKKTRIADQDSFVSKFDDFMTPEISDAIVSTKYSDLFVNAKGVMFGDGQAWITGICKDPSCASVNVRLVSLQSVKP